MAEADPGSQEFRGPHRLLPLLVVLPATTAIGLTLGWGWITERVPAAGEAGGLGWWALAAVGIFGPILLLMRLRGGVAIVLDEEGIESRRDGRTTTRLAWSEVGRIRWEGGVVRRTLVVSNERGTREIRIRRFTKRYGHLTSHVLETVTRLRRADLPGGPRHGVFRMPWTRTVPFWTVLLGFGLWLWMSSPIGWFVLAGLMAVGLAAELTLSRTLEVEPGRVAWGGRLWRRSVDLGSISRVRLKAPRAVSAGRGDTMLLPPSLVLEAEGTTHSIPRIGPDLLEAWETTERARRASADEPRRSRRPILGRLARSGALAVGALALVLHLGVRANSLLLTSATYGPPVLVQLALGLGSDPDSPGFWDRSPLYLAAWRDRPSVARILLEAGADPDVGRASNGFTPLHRAARNGHLEVARLLLDAGATLEARSDRGSTAFLQAAYGERSEVLRFLAGAGADLDAARPGSGQTALIWAVREEKWDLALLLVELGARGDIEVVRAAARGGSAEPQDPSDGSLLPVPFEVTGDRHAWSVEGRYSGVIVEDEEGLQVRLDRAVIWVRAEHGAPVTVGEVRAALGRREGGSWTFHASSERRAVGRRLAPGDSLFLDDGLEFSLVGAESDWLSDLSLVFEHSLLRPGEVEPYGWTWAAGPVADTGSPARAKGGRR